MQFKKRLSLIILTIYLSSQLLTSLGYIHRNQVFASENTKNTLNSLIALLVDDKIYDNIENELKRYAKDYIQQKYQNSKALVLKLNTKEYTAPEIVKLLENLYFDGEKSKSSQLIGTILVGEIPFPVVQYQDYFFPSIYPYVDFLDQKYLRNPDTQYFSQAQENGQAEIWHGVINFQADTQKYKDFFAKLKIYNSDPEKFVDKKIWYDDFIALQSNMLEENEKLYKNKLAFAEDLIYHRYTDLLFNILKGNNEQEIQTLLNGFAENLKEVGSPTTIQTQNNTPPSKTPTKLLEQKLEGVIKNYTTLISLPLQNTLNQNIAASDRWTNNADNHYQKLQLKDELILGNKTANGVIKSINDKLEAFVDAKLQGEKYAMMSVIPTFYKQEQDERKRILRKRYYFPKIRNHFRFFYFGKDANSINKAEDASIYRGSYRNLEKLGTYSSIINDPLNPAKSQYDTTNLQTKSFGASYDAFSTQISANRGFNMLATQPEYELYQKEKTHAHIEYDCKKRRFGLKRKWVPCLDVRRKGVGKCDPNAKKLEFNKNSRKREEQPNYDEMTDCENFEQFGNRVRGGGSPLNINMDTFQNGIYQFKGRFDPKSARKPIFDIAGSVALRQAEIQALSFLGLKYYNSPTKILHRDGVLKDPTDHSLSYEQVDYTKVPLGNKIFKKEGKYNFALIKPKHYRTDIEEGYHYKLVDTLIKHDTTTPTQINGYKGLKYSLNNEIGIYYTQMSGDLAVPNNFPDPILITTFNTFKAELALLTKKVEEASSTGEYNIILGKDTTQTQTFNSFLQHKSLLGKYVDNVDYQVAIPISTTINSIIHQQIERNPKIGLYTPRFNQILKQFEALDTYLIKQEQAAKQIHQQYLELITHATDIITTISEKITLLEKKKTELQNQLTSPFTPNNNRDESIKQLNATISTLQQKIANLTLNTHNDERKILQQQLKQTKLHLQITELERHIQEAQQAKQRILQMKDNILLAFNELTTCNAHHTTLGEYLNINDDNKLIGAKEIKTSCQDDNDSSSGSGNDKTLFAEMRESLKESKQSFQKLFYADSSNPQITIPGMSILTPDRPIDSPRYISFQGINHNEIKLIYPNLFKVEAFHHHNNLLKLKTPQELKQALKTYFENKVREYNTLLSQEREAAIKHNLINSPHYHYLYQVNPLATPTLEKTIRPYQLFTYEEFLQAIGGEAVLNTLAELLYYQNIGISHRPLSDDIAQDIKFSQEHFDINKKIDYILSQYLTEQNDQKLTDNNTIAPLILPKYSSQGYEVGFINSSDNDYIANATKNASSSNIFAGANTLRQNSTSSGGTEQAILIDQQTEKECGFSYNEALLLVDIKTRSSPWLEGFQCRLKEVGKKPLKLDISRNNEIVKDLKEHVLGDKILKAFKKQTTPEESVKTLDTPEKIAGTVLENIEITTAKNRIPLGESAFLTFSTSDPLLQKQTLQLTLSTQGQNCIKRGEQNTCTSTITTTINLKQAQQIPFELGKTTTGLFILNTKLCDASKSQCGNKNFTYVVTPGAINTLKIELGEQANFPAGAFIPLQVNAFDSYQNPISRSLDPYLLSADKGGFIIGGTPQKTIEISDFEYDPILYKSDSTSKGAVHFTIRKKSDPNQKILAKNQAQIFPAILEINHKGNKSKQITYQLNTLPLLIKNKDAKDKINENKIIKLDLTLKTPQQQLLPITTKASINIANQKVQSYLLKQDEKDGTPILQSTSSVIFNEGKAQLYLLPNTQAGEELISILIPGLPAETIKIHLTAGEPAILNILPEKTILPAGATLQGKLKLTDLRNNPILTPSTIKRTTTSSSQTTTQHLHTKNGEVQFSYTVGSEDTSLLLNAKLESKKLETNTNIQVQKQFLENAIKNGLNIMYLNLFGSDRGNQWGYLSEKKSFGENIITKSSKTLAITTQSIDLKKIKKTALLLGNQGRFLNNENFELSANLSNKLLNITIPNIGTIKILDPIQHIQIANNDIALSQALTKKENTLILYDLNPSYRYQQGKLRDQNQKELGSRHQGLLLKSSRESKFGLPIRELHFNGEAIASALLPQINYAQSSASILHPQYSFDRAFDQGSTNKIATALFHNSSSLQENYQGYDSIHSSDQREKYIGFRADFKNISSFAAGKTVGEATIPFGSEFLINLGDPLIQRIEKNKNIENSDYNGGIEKVIYTDTKSSIQKVIDIDYNNDGLKDLLVIYADGTIKLQKQYQDKNFKNMETLLLSAEQIQEVFVGDIDGNHYQDILIKNTKHQLRAYLNDGGKFDVDGRIACLNTNVAQGKISETPQLLSGVNQLFIQDMDQDNTLDIVTFDKMGDIKIFYGKGNKDQHSYLSTNPFHCDNQRYIRQSKQTKLVQNIGIQLNNKAVKDQSLVRRPGLKLPTDEQLTAEASKQSTASVLDTLPASIKNQLNKAESGASDIDTDALGKLGQHLDTTEATLTTINLFEKYLENPFKDVDLFDDKLPKSEQAFIPIKSLSTQDNDKLIAYKTYTDLNQGTLLNNEAVKITVTLQANDTVNGAMFFDTVEGPWNLAFDHQHQPQHFKFEQGYAQINPSLHNYPYYLSNINLKKGEKLIRSYQVNYSDQGNSYTIAIDDINIKDFEHLPNIAKTVPKDGYLKDTLPDIVLRPVDGCVKQQAILFNTQSSSKRNYSSKTINLQELADAYAKAIADAQKAREKELQDQIKKAQDAKAVEELPGLSDIGESYPTEDLGAAIWEQIKNGEPITMNLKLGSLIKGFDEIEQKIQQFADMACNGFSFGAGGGKANCQGLPIPFNQAFLAPGNYHIMGCIPLEPLTRTLGRGLPVFHFPGTLHTPFGPIPIPRGQSGPGDSFLRVSGGTYPSMIRIYAAPTLTGQLGIAICGGPHAIGKNLPSPLADMGGNCIVTSIAPKCGGGGGDDSSDDHSTENHYQSWVDSYGKSNTCTGDPSNSPFLISAGTTSPSDSPNQLSNTFLGGSIIIDQSPSIEMTSDAIGLFIQGERIEGVKDLKNKILGGNQKGIQKILMGFLIKQVEYIKNNLLRWRIDIYLPDFSQLLQDTQSIGEAVEKFTDSGTGNKSLLPANLPKEVKKLIKNKEIFSKEGIKKLNLAGGDNPFEQLKELFNQTKLVNISTQNVNIKIPRIYHEDIEAYSNYLRGRADLQKNTLNSRSQRVQSIILSCPKELPPLSKNTDTPEGQKAFKNKQAECQNAEHLMNKITLLTNKLFKLNDQIFQNIEVLEQYKQFPLELYDWIHASDRYIAEISGILNSFFGYLNYWMDINAKRFSQYIDVFVTILAVIKSYQVIINFSTNWTSKCSNCTKDTYDQYACKLSFLCDGIPLDPLPIPNIKIPNLLIDLSHIDLGLDIVLPHFTFVPESIHLPRLPNLPLPPNLGLSLDFNFDIGDIPILPAPPTLPDLPSLLPHVKMQLPILPPAPKIPALPDKLSSILKIAEDLGKILCIIKSGIGLVGENSVKARIEQKTQRSYKVPRVDEINLTDKLRKTPLQGVDYQIDSFLNLQYNFDGFYAFIKSTTDGINNRTQLIKDAGNIISNNVEDSYAHLEQLAQSGVNNLEKEAQNWIDKQTDNINETINNDNNKQDANLVKAHLNKQLQTAIDQLHTPQDKAPFQQILALTEQNTQIQANHSDYQHIHQQVQNILNQHKSNASELANLVKKDYDRFLLTLDTHNNKEQSPQLVYTTSLLTPNPQAEHLFKNNHIIDEYVQLQSQQINGYLNALEQHGAKGLNMSNLSYLKSKNYLNTLSQHIKHYYAMRSSSYAGSTPLITKSGVSSHKPLLTQIPNTTPNTTTTQSADYSDFVKGVLVKSTDQKSLINVVNSEYNYEKYQHYYQQDINNDKKADLIARDEYNIYIKYADDATPKGASHYKHYYQLTPSLNNKTKKYEKSNGDLFKLYDHTAEVKNFELIGQTFDALSFGWTHHNTAQNHGYLIKISDRIDSMKEKFDTDQLRYVLILPRGTSLTGKTLRIEEKEHSIQSLLDSQILYTVKYYNPSSEKLRFGISELPRAWQYLQIASLGYAQETYTPNSPRSNQVLGGRQIIADTAPPQAHITLLRTKKNSPTDEGNQLEGYVGSYYDLHIEREDNVQMQYAAIYEEDQLLAEQKFDTAKGLIRLPNLFFTEKTEKHYTITARDSEGNTIQDTITLTIKTPGIQIDLIERFTGRKEGILNPILIHSSIETDIDKGEVHFERSRNEIKKEITALTGGKETKYFPVTTDQTKVIGAYFDYGDLIGMYNQDGKLLGTVNAENGEILIEKAYTNQLHLSVSFEKHHPIIKLMQGNKMLFDVTLSPEKILGLEVKKGELIPLKGQSFGQFDQGYALMINKKPLLYISPTGELSSKANIEATYHFDSKQKAIQYHIKEHRFGDEVLTITLKTKAL